MTAVQDTAGTGARPGRLQLRLRGDSGAAAVEFALVVPLLLLLVFGIIDFGALFSQNLALNNAARDAARYGVVRQIDGSPARTCAQVLKRARDTSSSLAMTSSDVAVSVVVNGATVCGVAAGQPLTSATGNLAKAPCVGTVSGVSDQLRVTTTYQAGLLVPVFGPTSFTLNGNGYFRCEYST